MSFLGKLVKKVAGPAAKSLLGPLGGAAVGAIGSLLGGKKQADGAKDAANLQAQQYQQNQQLQQPFIQGGYAANDKLSTLLGLSSDPNAEGFGSLLKGFGADEFNQYLDPGYQFRKQQGEQSVLNSAAAGSGSMSGAALKDLLSFNSDLASTEYGNAFDRYQTQQGNIFQRLSGLTTLGQNAAAGVGSQGTALAGNAGQALTNAGTASGAGIIGAGNAANTGLSNLWLSDLIKQSTQQKAVS